LEQQKVEIKPNGVSAKEFIKKLAGFSVSTWISAVLAVVATLIMTRLFIPEEVGKINLFNTFLSLFCMVTYLGLDQAYTRFHNEPTKGNNHKGILTICIGFSLIFSIIVSIFIFIFADELSIAISGEKGYFIPICISLALIASVLFRFLNLSMRMAQKALLYSIQVITWAFVGKVLFISVAFVNPNHKNAILLITAGLITTALFFTFIQFKKCFTNKFVVNKNTIKTLFFFALPLMPIDVLAWLNNSVAQFFLRRFVDFSAIGIYTNAVTIVAIISVLKGGFNTYWVPFAYENYKHSQDKIRKVHDIITLVVTAFALIIILFQDVIYLLIGSDFRESRVFFAFLILSPVCYTIAETTGLGINIEKKTYLNIITFSVSTFINIVLCFILLPIIGITGAAIAAASSAVVMLIIRSILGERYYRCVSNYFKTGAAVLIVIIAAVCSLIFTEMLLIRYCCLILICTGTLILYRRETIYLYSIAKSFVGKGKH
jgi:O-antigen/teichoic acid export membrane protein